MEKPLRIAKVKPINSESMYSTLPIEELFTGLVQGNSSIMFFVGRILSFWGYTEIAEIDVIPVDLKNFNLGEFSTNGRILQKTLSAIKLLHFRHRGDKEKQLKDFGRIIWLLEEYLHRTDHYCPECSNLITLRFPDIYEICPMPGCGAKLEAKEFMHPRFRKKKTLHSVNL